MRSVVRSFFMMAVLMTTLSAAGAASQDSASQDGKFLLTVFLRHDQSMTLDEITAHQKKTGFLKMFPPEGVEIVSWHVVMGIGQVITLHVPPDKLRAVNLSVEKGDRRLFDEIRYFFYITNDRRLSAAKVVASAHQRCDQENLNAQLLSGVRALRAPVDNLESNWAYMVMSSLAWTLKAWLALLLPAKGRWKERHKAEKRAVLRMEFRTFLNAFMRVPCQIVRTGRRIVYRVLSWNPWQHVFLRAAEALRAPLRC